MVAVTCCPLSDQKIFPSGDARAYIAWKLAIPRHSRHEGKNRARGKYKAASQPITQFDILPRPQPAKSLSTREHFCGNVFYERQIIQRDESSHPSLASRSVDPLLPSEKFCGGTPVLTSKFEDSKPHLSSCSQRRLDRHTDDCQP